MKSSWKNASGSISDLSLPVFLMEEKNHKRELWFYKKQIEATEMERAATNYKLNGKELIPKVFKQF